jgi:hypothetical protein
VSAPTPPPTCSPTSGKGERKDDELHGTVMIRVEGCSESPSWRALSSKLQVAALAWSHASNASERRAAACGASRATVSVVPAPVVIRTNRPSSIVPSINV